MTINFKQWSLCPSCSHRRRSCIICEADALLDEDKADAPTAPEPAATPAAAAPWAEPAAKEAAKPAEKAPAATAAKEAANPAEKANGDESTLVEAPTAFTLVAVPPLPPDQYLPEWHHAGIVGDLTLPFGNVANPWGIWLAGGPGSGKGHVLQGLVKLGCLPAGLFAHLDVDAQREHLPAWRNDTNQPKLISSVERTQKEAGYINDLAMARAAHARINFVVDGTLRDPDHALRAINRMRCLSDEWKQTGAQGAQGMKSLRVCVILVDADEDVCFQRVELRAQKTGRPVQKDFVKSCNRTSRESAAVVRSAADCFIHIKNNESLEFVKGSKAELRMFTLPFHTQVRVPEPPLGAHSCQC